jgi:hypothetical protein
MKSKEFMIIHTKYYCEESVATFICLQDGYQGQNHIVVLHNQINRSISFRPCALSPQQLVPHTLLSETKSLGEDTAENKSPQNHEHTMYEFC